MITGVHTIIYSKSPERDRAFLKDVLKFPSVSAGEGWLIFGLPPGELGVHPSESNDVHEFYLMVNDIEAFRSAMESQGVACSASQDLGWGILAHLSLPGGGKLGVYQPRHPRPEPMVVAKQKAKAKSSRRAAPKKAKRAKKPASKPKRTRARR